MINNVANPFDPANNSGNVDYSIFRKGIRPDYEDQYLKHGGRIILKLPSNNPPHKLFEVWVHLILALIGRLLHPPLAC